jgi:hypothetical protein
MGTLESRQMDIAEEKQRQIDLEESLKRKEIENAEERLKAVKIDIERKIAIKRIQDRED